MAQTYINVAKALAVTNDCPLVNLNDRWVSYTAAAALSPSFYYDAIHPSASGYADIATAIVPLLVA